MGALYPNKLINLLGLVSFRELSVYREDGDRPDVPVFENPLSFLIDEYILDNEQ